MFNLIIILAIIAVLTMILLYARLETHRRKSSQISELPERDNRTKNVIHGTILGAILGAAFWAIVLGLCNVALATIFMYMDGIAKPVDVYRLTFGGAILGAIIGAIAGMVLGTVVWALVIGFISRRKEPPNPARRQGAR